MPTEESGDQTRTSWPINGMWEHREKLKQLLCLMEMFFKQKLVQMEKLLWNGIIQYIIGQISILIHMIMKYDGTPRMDILNRSLLLIIPMEHRNSNNMEDEKRWETFYMYQTTEA